ncbi:MAG: hypothetical protein VR70_05800 [Rhodospirillaceae bacterium BRH_c57]|nr:MAG: hypothetical protein VR70_05800 [Rhodospirillaceae bacterium BRH_c57]
MSESSQNRQAAEGCLIVIVLIAIVIGLLKACSGAGPQSIEEVSSKISLVTRDKGVVTVYAAMSSIDGGNLDVTSALITAQDVARWMFEERPDEHVDVNSLVLRAVAQTLDRFGNAGEQQVFFLVFRAADLRRVQWDNMPTYRIGGLATVTVNTSLGVQMLADYCKKWAGHGLCR